MASTQMQVEAIKNAVSSTSTCSPATLATLKSLILPKDGAPAGNSSSVGSTKTARPRSKTNTAPTDSKKANAGGGSGLAARERASLATEVINATLRALGEAAKTAPTASPTKRQAESGSEPGKTTSRLRRSDSAPVTPLQPRSLNRVSTSPTKAARPPVAATTPHSSTQCLATVECARVALAALRGLETGSKIALPELQLETAMSSLVGRLVTLGLHEQAVKELRILKERLQGRLGTGGKRKPNTTTTATATTKTNALAELLDFGAADASSDAAVLPLVVATQMHVLKVLLRTKRPAQIEAALPVLRHAHGSSPVRCIQALAGATSASERAKAARQLDTVAQIYLALTPGVSSREDATATDARLSVSPATALELQALGLEARMELWEMTGRRGSVDRDVLSPLSKCLAAYARRTGEGQRPYTLCCRSFSSIYARIHEEGECQSRGQGSRHPLATIYQLLASTAREEGRLEEAVRWAEALRETVDGSTDSIGKQCSVAMQLLGLQLKHGAGRYAQQLDGLAAEVLAGVQGPIRGDSTELEELLANMGSLRRAAAAVLFGGGGGVEEDEEESRVSRETRRSLQALILQCPRFCLRWLGAPPDPKSSTKDYLRYEQRRRLLAKSAHHNLDSAFFLARAQMERHEMDWDVLEGVLSDSLTLLRYMGDVYGMDETGTAAAAAATPFVKISHLYYMEYNALRQQQQQKKEAKQSAEDDAAVARQLRALRRSVECVRERPAGERERAQMLSKLERMVELSGSMGRTGEALAGLQAMRASLVEGDDGGGGVLAEVAEALATRPARAAWKLHSGAEMLARVLGSIAALEPVWVNWAADRPEAEQAAVLEHRLWLVQLGSGVGGGGGRKKPCCPAESKTTEPKTILDDPVVDALLRIYTPTRFPVRRLRTLLRLLCSAIGGNNCSHSHPGCSQQLFDLLSVVADAAAELDETGVLDGSSSGSLGDDGELARYLAHIKALYRTVAWLVDGPDEDDLSPVREAVSVWRSLVERRGEEGGERTGHLEERVDDIPELLGHLGSVADALRMRGHEQLLVAVQELAADVAREGVVTRDLLDTHADLALQYLRLGQSGRAERVFAAAEVTGSISSHLPGDAVASFHLAVVDYLVTTGSIAEANDRMAVARAAFEAAPKATSRSRPRVLFSYASYAYARISLERGDSHYALVYGRESVRMAFQEWSRVESQFKQDEGQDQDQDQEKQANTSADSSLGSSIMVRKDGAARQRKSGPAGPEAWRVFRQMVRSLSTLSAVYDHLGQYQETLYYAEQADKMARAAGSRPHLLQSAAWTAAVHLKAGNADRALELAARAREEHRLCSASPSCPVAAAACRVAAVYRGLGQPDVEADLVAAAEATLTALGGEPAQDTAGLEAKMAKLDMNSDKKPAKRTRAATTTTTTTTRRKATTTTMTRTTKRAKQTPAPAPETSPAPILPPTDAHLVGLQSSVLAHKATSLQRQKDWATATATLHEIRNLARLPAPVSHGRLVTLAACLLGQSLEDMARDSVFSVVHDSTLSFPTVLGAGTGDDLSSPPAKTRSSGNSNRKGPARRVCPPSSTRAFLDKLKEAQDHLVEAHAAVAVAGDSSLVHRVAAALQNVALLLSAVSSSTSPSSFSSSPPIGHATCSRDLARNLAWRRERRALALEKAVAKPDGSEWPVVAEPDLSSSPDPSLFLSSSPLDAAHFQRDYVDIIPDAWTVFSVALGEDEHDLCITRLRAGQDPFVVRLPLERACSRDADSDSFTFREGRAEMADIVRLANETCHDARDMTAKGAKSAWWADREALDRRLAALLDRIEREWLGGFRGIFARPRRLHHDDDDDDDDDDEQDDRRFAAFQTAFQRILDKHLPSRRRVVRGRKTRGAAPSSSSSSVTLDPRILDLIVGLEEGKEDDLDDELTDLLYFVVDILQFHGERNAYDEIDFDSMVVETLDALRAYHAQDGYGGSGSGHDKTHSILVLDKSLHAFPWESLPCLRGRPVSRVSSLACLRRLILEQRQPSSSLSAPGHHISRSSGAYILNPSADLKTTQDTFEQALAAQLPPAPTWTRIAGRAPTETEFERALAETDVLLYFGHGSGAQYIRGRAVRRLDKCRAAALLMGCSSAALAGGGSGEANAAYEAAGPAWNYQLAGCPAVVGTLWDVTDRDIDRLAGRALEEWGLLRRGTFGSEKIARAKTERGSGGQQPKDQDAEQPASGSKASLVEAITRAREEACRFRYLTAAAVVVYGIPVYVEE